MCAQRASDLTSADEAAVTVAGQRRTLTGFAICAWAIRGFQAPAVHYSVQFTAKNTVYDANCQSFASLSR